MTKLVACADLHLRDSTPTCRTDDYWKAQENKFQFLIDTAIEKECDIYCAGDFFHKAKSSSFLEAWAIGELFNLKEAGLKFHVIPGQHDIPSHNIELISHSSLWVLEKAEVINLYSTAFEQPTELGEEIMMIHKMIHKDKPIHKDIISTKASALLSKYQEAKVIISGDNHIPFLVQNSSFKNYLINCGSMMRMTADQSDYKPRFYFIEIDKKKNKFYCSDIYYPIDSNVIDSSYLAIEKERDKRMDSFVNRISESYEIDLDFEKNLENFFKTNKIRKPVQEKCWEALA